MANNNANIIMITTNYHRLSRTRLSFELSRLGGIDRFLGMQISDSYSNNAILISTEPRQVGDGIVDGLKHLRQTRAHAILKGNNNNQQR